MKGHQEFQQYTRITIPLEDHAGAHQLVRLHQAFPTPQSSSNPIVKSYDILAVVPQNEKTFYQACSSLEVDIIALDMAKKLPFVLKPTSVSQAVARGVMFEIIYSSAIRGYTPAFGRI
jgi:RNase P/RNase MRP subunit p30